MTFAPAAALPAALWYSVELADETVDAELYDRDTALAVAAEYEGATVYAHGRYPGARASVRWAVRS